MKRFFFSIFLFACVFLRANNVQVTSPSLTGQNTTDHTTQVQFNISWENSWRDIVNWDAVWIFVKYKKNDGIWRHASLGTAGHIAPTGSTIYSTTDGKGAFMYRSANGSGNNNWTGVQLKWLYGVDGVGDNDLVTVKVFAVEMVYVPEAAFWVGDGSGRDFDFTQAGTTLPFRILSEAELTLGGTSSSNLGVANTYDYHDFNASTTATLPAIFPKGFAAFYCMKYEISQGQYADFLNTLSLAQAHNLYSTYGLPFRGTITEANGIFTSSRPDRAAGWVSMWGGLAYADWSGLRPMTELEFEKACRGDQYPVANEYAWGSTVIDSAQSISGTEDGTETVTNTGANCVCGDVTFTGGDGGSGPLRCGIFARNSTTREQAGASYYGIMELSGNLLENAVSLTAESQRSFDGRHGDGQLADNGYANTPNWSYTYLQQHGGNWHVSYTELAVSKRNPGGAFNNSAMTGFRAVRTAPVVTDSIERNNSRSSDQAK